MSAARHCARLTALRGPSPADHPLASEVAERLAHALQVGLEPLLDGAARVTASPPRLVPARELAGRPARGHHLALAFAGESARALITLGAEPLLRLVDRRFGGAGTDCAAPTRLPGSARLLADRLLAPLIAGLDGCWGDGPAVRSSVVQRDDDLARVRWSEPSADVLHLALEVGESGRPDWSVDVAFAAALVTGWLGRSDRRAPAAAPLSVDAASRGRLSHVALPLRAVVDEPRLPLRRVSALAVGDCIPLGLGGTASLRLGDRTVAVGVVGASAGKVAIRVTAATPQLALPAPLETRS